MYMGRLRCSIGIIIGMVVLLSQTGALTQQPSPDVSSPVRAAAADTTAHASIYLPLVSVPPRAVTITPDEARVLPDGLVLGAPTGALTEARTLNVGAPPANLPALPAGVSLVDAYELSAAAPFLVSGDVPLVMGFPYTGDGANLRVALFGQFAHREEPTWIFSDLALDPATNLAVLLWYGIEQPALTFALVRDERVATAADAGIPSVPRQPPTSSAPDTLAQTTTFEAECDRFSFAEGEDKTGTDQYPDCLPFEAQLAEWMDGFHTELLRQGFDDPHIRRNARLEMTLPDEDMLIIPPQPAYRIDIAGSASADCAGINGEYTPTIRKVMLCFDRTKPTSDLQTTAAHELFHAVQARYLDIALFANPYADWFIEGTATLAGGTLALSDGRTLTLDSRRRVRRLSEPLHHPSEQDDNYRAQRFWRVALERAPGTALSPLIGVMEQIAPLRSEYAFVYGTDSALNGLGEPYAAWVADNAFAGCGFREPPPSVDNYLTIRTTSHNSSDPDGPRVPTSVLNSSAYHIDLIPSEKNRLVVAAIVRGTNDDRPLDPIGYVRTDATDPPCTLHQNRVELLQIAGTAYSLYATISDPNLPTGVSASDTGEAQIVFEPLDVTLSPEMATTYTVEADTVRSVLPRLTLWSTAHNVTYDIILGPPAAGTNPGVISFAPDAEPTGSLNAENSVQEVPLHLDCRGRSVGSVYSATFIPTIMARDGTLIEEGVPDQVEITVACVEPDEPIPSCTWTLAIDNQSYAGSFAAYRQIDGTTLIQLLGTSSDLNPDAVIDISFPGPPRAGTFSGELVVGGVVPPFSLFMGDGTEGAPPPPTLLVADRGAVELEGRLFGQMIRGDASSGELVLQPVNVVIEFAAQDADALNPCP